MPKARASIANMNRRTLMSGALGAAGLAGVVASSSHGASRLADTHRSSGAVDWEVIEFDSPEDKFKHFMRMAYGLDEEPFVFWAMLTYNYFKPGADSLPVPIFGKEAMELSQAKRMRENVWQVQGNNLSFPLDVETGEYITEFRNPITGEMVPVPDAKVADDDPGLIITPQGNRAIGKLDMAPMSSRVTFRREGEYVSMLRIRPNPRRFGYDTWPIDFIELGTQRVLAKDFYNPEVRHLYGTASATFLLPAEQRWVPIDKAPEMAGGYIVAHIDSLKLPSVDHMPQSFRDHAHDLGYGHVLKLDPERFREDV